MDKLLSKVQGGSLDSIAEALQNKSNLLAAQQSRTGSQEAQWVEAKTEGGRQRAQGGVQGKGRGRAKVEGDPDAHPQGRFS